MERFNRHWVTAEEHKRIQLRITELEAENEKLKNKSDIIRELIGLMANNSLFKGSGIRQESSSNSNNSLEQVVELAKDLSNDIRNIMKSINH